MKLRWIFICIVAGTLAAHAELNVKYVALEDEAFEKPDPSLPIWTDLPPAIVTMMPQMIATPSKMTVSTPTIEARAMHNGRWIAVAVRWADEGDNRMVTQDDYSDAVAIAFPVGQKNSTSPFMGGPGTPVEINHWKAVWQRDVEEGYADITDIHPNTAVVKYHGGSAQLQHPLAELVQNEEALLAMPAIRLGNPVSQVNREFPVEQLAAVGFTGSITTQSQQNSRAWGRYADGHWTVIFARPLDTGDLQDKALAPGMTHEVNFAVWDGQEHDVGAKKSYSMFVPLILEALP